MRVASLSNPTLMVDLIGRSQAELTRLQSQTATGRAFQSPSEDPFGATRSLQLTRALDQLEQFEANAGRAEDRLTLQEVTMGDLGDQFRRVRELAVQANSGILSDADRRAIGAEVQQIRQEALSLANAVDGEGRFLFSGFRSNVEPFTESNGAVSYQGDQSERQLTIGPGRTIVDGASGDAVFMRVTNGNGTFVTSAEGANTGTGVIDAGSLTDVTTVIDQSYRISFTSPTDYEVSDSAGTVLTTGVYDPDAGNDIAFAGVQVGITGAPQTGVVFVVDPSRNQDVFATLDQLVEVLNTPQPTPADRAALGNAINSALVNIDQAQENFSVQRARAGTLLNAIDSQRALNDESAILLQASRSAVEDVDLVETISALQLQISSLQAAQQSFVSVQSLSLFNFL
ncbi:MAG: flagellar hook-associated protein FlgL [Pseudomonadota bacterium]